MTGNLLWSENDSKKNFENELSLILEQITMEYMQQGWYFFFIEE